VDSASTPRRKLRQAGLVPATRSKKKAPHEWGSEAGQGASRPRLGLGGDKLDASFRPTPQASLLFREMRTIAEEAHDATVKAMMLRIAAD
jgi:hypothetical protein